MRDSSLSACIQAVVAAEVGHLELAYDYFGEAALMDLDDLEHNTRDGLHIASLAGAWIAAVAGFGGMRDHGGQLSFAPRLPGAADPSGLPDRLPGEPPAGRGRARPRPRTHCSTDRRSSCAISASRSPSAAKSRTFPAQRVAASTPPTQPRGRAPVRRGHMPA